MPLFVLVSVLFALITLSARAEPASLRDGLIPPLPCAAHVQPAADASGEFRQ